MKYKTLGATKGVQNVGNCRAEVEMRVGMGVILDQVNKIAKLPASEAEAKSCYRIVNNINDKPEQHNFSETVIVPEGDFVRADDLHSVKNLEICFAAAEITDNFEDLAVGDNLVFDTTGMLKKSTAVTGYAVHFEIIDKTGYMGAGVLALIRVSE